MKRESNFEFLRILCIIGIVIMHSWGLFYSTATGINLVSGVFINSLFNSCVSIFILISGYYGIKFSMHKLIRFEITLIFYSVLSFGINYFVTGNFKFGELAKACLPFSSGKYWYMTVYILLLVFSKYINKIPEALDKKSFKKLLWLLLLVFSILPTIVQKHVMDDGGKGFCNMFLIYLLGRYIRIYRPVVTNRKKTVAAGLGILLLEFTLNYAITVIAGNEGVEAPFARDCSLLIIMLSVCIFEFFRGMKIQSDVINRVAKHVMAVYLLERSVRSVIYLVIDPNAYVESVALIGVITVGVIGAFLICVIIDICKVALLGKVEDVIVNKLCLAINFLKQKTEGVLLR